MSGPSDELRQLAAEGRQLRAQYIAATNARRSQSSRVALGVDVVDLFFDLTGYKRAAKHVGKILAQESSTAEETRFIAQHDAWTQKVRQALGRATVIEGGVPAKPNSAPSIRLFNRTQSFVRLDSKLAHAIPFLEGLAEEHVVWNEDLNAEAAPLKTEAPPVPDMTARELALAEGVAVLGLLARLPHEREAVQGALLVFESRTPDHGRQALGSLRTALESLVRRTSGESDWSAGLVKLVPGERRRKTIKQVYSFLSGYGTHNPEIPAEADIVMGFRLTFTAIRALLDDDERK